MATRGTKCDCLRCREVRGKAIEIEKLKLDDLKYQADDAEEHFISFITSDDKVAGFLRLSLPNADAPKTGISDLEDAAIIREVHVYGLSLEVGSEKSGSAQHVGLGTRLMLEAEQVALKSGFSKMAIIAAVGTRGYYLDRGFKRGELYLVKEIK